MSRRADLLFALGLPPQASPGEIEYFYLERRAEAEKRLRGGDIRAQAEIDRLEGVFRLLEGMDENALEIEAEPAAATGAKTPSHLRATGSLREANGSLACGVAACLVVLWAFYVDRSGLTGSSTYVLGLLQSPVYFLIYVLALAAELLSHASLKDESRALFLVKQGLEPTDRLDESQVSRARAGRYLGRIAVALAILLAILLVSSFFHFLGR
ncbi:MAG: hypothetical protein ABSC36_02410 [Gaiellaceae bacterium]